MMVNKFHNDGLMQDRRNSNPSIWSCCPQVQAIQEDAAKLLVAYSGDKAREIQEREMEVINAWRNLQIHVEARKKKLSDTNDLYRFFNLVRDLMLWMDDMIRQMNTQEKPRWTIIWGIYAKVTSCQETSFRSAIK